MSDIRPKNLENVTHFTVITKDGKIVLVDNKETEISITEEHSTYASKVPTDSKPQGRILRKYALVKVEVKNSVEFIIYDLTGENLEKLKQDNPTTNFLGVLRLENNKLWISPQNIPSHNPRSDDTNQLDELLKIFEEFEKAGIDLDNIELGEEWGTVLFNKIFPVQDKWQAMTSSQKYAGELPSAKELYPRLKKLYAAYEKAKQGSKLSFVDFMENKDYSDTPGVLDIDKRVKNDMTLAFFEVVRESLPEAEKKVIFELKPHELIQFRKDLKKALTECSRLITIFNETMRKRANGTLDAMPEDPVDAELFSKYLEKTQACQQLTFDEFVGVELHNKKFFNKVKAGLKADELEFSVAPGPSKGVLANIGGEDFTQKDDNAATYLPFYEHKKEQKEVSSKIKIEMQIDITTAEFIALREYLNELAQKQGKVAGVTPEQLASYQKVYANARIISESDKPRQFTFKIDDIPAFDVNLEQEKGLSIIFYSSNPNGQAIAAAAGAITDAVTMYKQKNHPVKGLAIRDYADDLIKALAIYSSLAGQGHKVGFKDDEAAFTGKAEAKVLELLKQLGSNKEGQVQLLILVKKDDSKAIAAMVVAAKEGKSPQEILDAGNIKFPGITDDDGQVILQVKPKSE